MSAVHAGGSFPACRHRKRQRAALQGLRWLAAEPYRVFFASGALWSAIGVALWPMFYAHWIGFYPAIPHARIMIEAFGGAFVVGFLGTAGPRMATAPKLTPAELLWLFALHLAGAVGHLTLHTAVGDGLFLALLGSLSLSLLIRVAKFRRESPPPQMLLALAGLVCGMAGAWRLLDPATGMDLGRLRLANLLLYQGLLLPPVLGVGSFVFPRMLGGDFGEPKTTAQARVKLVRAAVAALLLVGSFVLEAKGLAKTGCWLRALTAAGYLLIEVRWRRAAEDAPRGTLSTGLLTSLVTGMLGLVLAGLFQVQHVSVEHLLYVSGFGMLMLIVGSRVLFGHSGDLAGFFVRGWRVRLLMCLGMLAAATRAVPAWAPSTTVSHHVYAAIMWAVVAVSWLLWHRRRFARREEE